MEHFLVIESSLRRWVVSRGEVANGMIRYRSLQVTLDVVDVRRGRIGEPDIIKVNFATNCKVLVSAVVLWRGQKVALESVCGFYFVRIAYKRSGLGKILGIRLLLLIQRPQILLMCCFKSYGMFLEQM
jgi:hypothetical protein